MPDGNTTGHGAQSSHTCRTKEIFSSLCGDTFANIALRLPWTVRQKDLSLHENPPDASISLAELLVSGKCLTCWSRTSRIVTNNINEPVHPVLGDLITSGQLEVRQFTPGVRIYLTCDRISRLRSVQTGSSAVIANTLGQMDTMFLKRNNFYKKVQIVNMNLS